MPKQQHSVVILAQANTIEDLDMMSMHLIMMTAYCYQYNVWIGNVTCRIGNSKVAINRLKAYVKTSTPDYVLVYKKEDLSGDKEGFIQLVEEFQKYGTRIIVYEQAISKKKKD